MQIEVFHGSDLVVTNPELRISSRALDFGPGFYTTTNREQAINFAKKVCERNQTTSAVVSVFKIDLDKLKQSLKGKWFESVRPLYNQLVFKTEAALKFLEFNRSFSVKV